MPSSIDKTRSFVVLSVKGDIVGSVENPTPSRDDLTRLEEQEHEFQNEENVRKEKPHRRNLLWECFSTNAFKTKQEKNRESPKQVQRGEEVASSHSSLRGSSNSSVKVPYSQVSGPQSSDLPPPQFYRERLQRHEGQMPDNPSAGNHPWNQSASSSEYTLQDSSEPPPSRIVGKVDVKTNSGCEKSPRESVVGMRWNEFKAELKSLFWDLVEYGKAKTWKKKILTVFVSLISCLVFYDLLFGRQDYIITWLHDFVVWMTTHHAAAVFAFVGIFVVSTLAFVPPTLLVFGAGYAFTVAMDSALMGVLAAVLSCFLGSCIGAIVAFVRSRYMMRDLVLLFAARYPLVRAIDQALKLRHGFWIMLLLRLCPIIPFNGLNYCCGITGVTLPDFTLSLVGILPFQLFTTILGATARAIELQNLKTDEYSTAEKWTFVGFVVTGVIFVVVAIVYGWRLVKQELRRELSMSEEEFECVLRSDASSSAFSFRLPQEGGEASLRSIGDFSENNSSNRSTPFQEEGEEWFWIWA